MVLRSMSVVLQSIRPQSPLTTDAGGTMVS